MKVVILAGGRGTRISEESRLRPKPMVEIGGKPILWHIMRQYASYGFNEFIICCGYKGHMIKEYFVNYYQNNSQLEIRLKDQQVQVLKKNSEPWKVTMVDTGLETLTAGRILKVRDYIGGEPFLLTYVRCKHPGAYRISQKAGKDGDDFHNTAGRAFRSIASGRYRQSGARF